MINISMEVNSLQSNTSAADNVEKEVSMDKERVERKETVTQTTEYSPSKMIGGQIDTHA